MNEFKLSIKNLSKTYASRSGPVLAVSNLTLDVHSDEIVSIVGPSGCGKTTVLNIIAGFVAPTTGHVKITAGAGAAGRKEKNGVVFQEDSVFPWMTVEDNIGYPL